MYYKVSFYDYELGYYVPYDKILHGFTIHETIDDTLDFATIVCHTDAEDKFKLWQSVKVEVWNGNFEEGEADFKKCFLIADIDATERHTIEKSFVCTITSIEPTKYLEKVICSSMSFTNKEDSLLQQLEKALINAEPIEDGQSPRFRLSQRLKNRLSGINGEDFFFTKPTLREILDGMLSVINCRAEVHEITDFNSIEIDYYDLNEVKSRIEILEVLNKQTIQNIEYLGSDIEAYGDNSFSGSREAIYHPSPNGWDTFKTDETELTTENAVIKTVYPIEEIKEFIIPITYILLKQDNWNSQPDSSEEITKLVDISSNVVDEETYNILPNWKFDVTNPDKDKTHILYKENTIFYRRGETSIQGSGLKTRIFFKTQTILENAIKNALWKQGAFEDYLAEHPDVYRVNEIEKLVNFKFLETIFRIRYVPYINLHARISKVGYKDVPSTIIDNQSEKIIDLERYGGNLYGTINRLGNKELKIDRKLYSINDDYNIGDITADGYVLTSKDLALYNGFIKAHYEFTKDFGKLNEKISINREKRIYNIPLESFVRDILIKEYIIADLGPSSETHPFIAEFIKTFNDQERNPITNALVQTEYEDNIIVKRWITTTNTNYTVEASSGDQPVNQSYLPDASNYQDGTIGRVYNNALEVAYFKVESVQEQGTFNSNLYELSVVPYTMATSLLFAFKFDDNYSAGISSDHKLFGVIGGRLQVPNPYVNSKGEYDKIHIRLFNDKSKIQSTDYNIIKLLPKTEEYYYESVIKHFDKTFSIKKDAFEHHSFTVQLEIVSNNPNIIIGFAIARLNALVQGNVNNLRLYASFTEKYALLNNQKPLGELVPNAYIGVMGENSITAGGEFIYSNLDKLASWGITDENDNLLIGVNKIGDADIKNVVHFVYRSVRN